MSAELITASLLRAFLTDLLNLPNPSFWEYPICKPQTSELNILAHRPTSPALMSVSVRIQDLSKYGV